MKSSDLTLFREICDSLDEGLYRQIQIPDKEFVSDVESGSKFDEFASRCSVEYDFSDIEEKLGVSLRYYQRLALYFTKYYFEKKYLINGNENNKLTYWMATGSGKTIIMKANIVDYFEYLRDKNPDEIEVVVTSPLKELIGQLQIEIGDFFANEYFRDFKFSYTVETTQSLIERYKSESHEIVGENQFRLLLVDEAHIGLGRKDKGAFVALRDALTQNAAHSFMFEYSATFYDITEREQIDEYARRIIYEYDYGKFYNDGYGKDFKFDVVKKDAIAEDENRDIKRNLDANFEAFHKKMEAFYAYNGNRKLHRGKLFPNRPLLVMAGNTVSANKESDADNIENSDIAKIVDYLANLESNVIGNHINIFNAAEGALHLLQNRANEDELLMAYGENTTPFGLVTVGDVKKFFENQNIQKLIERGKIIVKDIKFTDENWLFRNIDNESSPINILIGSRKFSAGWNSFRASQICLINFGTGSGPTIIQMFGRGVRLRGLNDDGKRTERHYVKENGGKTEFLPHSKENVLSKEKYDLLKYLETLFIYSLRSTYLKRFVEEDTDIYQKCVISSKEVSVRDEYKETKLPIFYVDKSVLDRESIIKVDHLWIENGQLDIHYTFNLSPNHIAINLPLIIDFTIKKETTLKFDKINYLKYFVDRAYIENLIYKRLQKNNITIIDFDLDYIISLLKPGIVTVKYDGEINSPGQFQRLLLKVAYALISKIKNKIEDNETKQKYKFDQEIKEDDYIDRYDIKFVLNKSADVKEVSDRLDKDKSYKLFIDSIINHYYYPLAINPNSDSRKVFETYKKCLDNTFTENYKTIIDSDSNFFKDIEFIRISPDKLEPNEFKFVCDLQEHISKSDLNAVIFRNKPRGNIGLIGNSEIFYPDFIIWYLDDKERQHIIFCDPKGIRNAETKWKVCDAPYYVKEIENEWGSSVILHSFIISNTPKKNIVWSPIDKLSIEQCGLFYNLVFMEDCRYIERIFESTKRDIRIHRDFMEYLEYYDNSILNEWLNDEKRKEHLKNLNHISNLNDLNQAKKLLLYFTLYKNRDLLKEEILNDTQDVIKSTIIEELLPSFITEIIPGAKIIYKIAKLIAKEYSQNTQ